MTAFAAPTDRRAFRVLLATNSRDRGSTSRTLEAWTTLLPQHGITPIVSIGGSGALLEALRSSGTTVYVQPIRLWPSVRQALPFASAVWRMVRMIRRERVSLVHVNEHDHHRVPALAAQLAGVPIVTHLRFRLDRSYAQWLFTSYPPARLFFTSATQRADTRSALAGIVPEDRWRVIYNGLSSSAFQPDDRARVRLRKEWGLTPETVALGMACAISKRKRVDHFIRLVAGLRDSGFPVHGFIAGEAHFPEDRALVVELRHQAAALDLGQHLTFLGYVEPVTPLYQAWDLCVSTSAYETFGMTVLEAMASGCATVAYPGGSVAEVAGDALPIVPDGDEAALLAASHTLCADSEARREIASAGVERARRFDIAESVSQLVREYRGVVDFHEPPRA